MEITIPKLPLPLAMPAGPVIVERSFPVGRENYFRLFKSQSLIIDITFRDDVVAPDAVTAHFENLAYNQSRLFEIALKNVAPRRFRIEMEVPYHGVNRFKIKYAQKGAWFWDCRPYSYFMVDPDHLRDFRIYTFIPNANGHFGQWYDTFKRIRDLGFNTIHLLPLSRMGHSESPYAAYDLFDVDPQLLDPKNPKTARAQLESLVQFSKDCGLRLCFDLVFNSIGVDSSIRQSRPEWLTEDAAEADGIKRGGWSDGKQWHKWMDLAYINYDTPCSQLRKELWMTMSRYALYWSSFASATGGMVRLDNLHSSHKAFVRRVLGEVREAFPDIITFGELFDTEERIEDMVLDYGLNFLLATPWEHKFVPQLRSYTRSLHAKHNRLRYLFPTTSHDSGSPAEEFGDVRSTTPRLVISTLFGPGPSGIVQGVEEGTAKKIRFIGRKGFVDKFGDHNFSDIIKKLNALIQEHDCFQTSGNLQFIDHDHNAILGACRFDTTTKEPRFLIFANMDILGTQNLKVNLASYGLNLVGRTLTDVLDHFEMRLAGSELDVELPPCGVKAFKIT